MPLVVDDEWWLALKAELTEQDPQWFAELVDLLERRRHVSRLRAELHDVVESKNKTLRN